MIRRATLPFLWVCLIGLNDKVRPDDDPLVQVALRLADVHTNLLGLNEPVQNVNRTDNWILEIQRSCFQLGVDMVNLFYTNVTTKMHRFMRHLDFHLMSFGMLRWGANDDNESKHKSVKTAYRVPNRRSSTLAEQLLRAGYADDASHGTNDSVLPPDVVPHPNPDLRLIISPLRCTQSQLNTPNSFQVRVDRAHSVKYISSRSPVWRCLSSLTLKSKFSWQVNPAFQYIFDKYSYRPCAITTEDVRMDESVYFVDGIKKHVIVQSILRSVRIKEHAFILIRRLQEAQPNPGNVLPTTKFNHGY